MAELGPRLDGRSLVRSLAKATEAHGAISPSNRAAAAATLASPSTPGPPPSPPEGPPEGPK